MARATRSWQGVSAVNDFNPTEKHRWTLIVGLVIGLLLIGLAEFTSRAPSPVSADEAASDQFSAERATSRLRNLLGDERPHPVGTAANRAVKNRLIRQLEALDVVVEEQDALGCSLRGARCAFTENVIATLPGRSENTVVLMAHYDSCLLYTSPSPRDS